MKSIFIAFIRLYQNTAPKRIRESCRFEPSCSEYMIISLNKFGVKDGLKKGIKRLRKCKPPYGGIDYP
ncbi:membrane protein insertion efficiency factor YidD [Labilibaculum manganireducens]|uniref:membrane protein insertion efficiency factor YidD n=1 Tax=Labilibaculum manganireducens TaxID=1940525 RepID=UPI00374A4D44